MHLVCGWSEEELASRLGISSAVFQQVRFGERIRVAFDIDEAALDLYTIKVLLQPLVENAITHGILSQRDRGTVEVAVALSDGVVRLVVRDDGKGFEQAPATVALRESPRVQKGYALLNIAMRIRLYFGDDYGLVARNRPEGGAEVSLTIPAIRTLEEIAVHETEDPAR